MWHLLEARGCFFVGVCQPIGMTEIASVYFLNDELLNQLIGGHSNNAWHFFCLFLPFPMCDLVTRARTPPPPSSWDMTFSFFKNWTICSSLKSKFFLPKTISNVVKKFGKCLGANPLPPPCKMGRHCLVHPLPLPRLSPYYFNGPLLYS